MCYAIPGKVESINAKMVVVDYFGEKKKALNEIAGLSVGDYIYAQGGYVITRVSKQEAEASLSVWKDLFFSLKETDNSLVRFSLSEASGDQRLLSIIKAANQGKKINPAELNYLFQLSDKESLNTLFRAANFLRQKYHSNACCVHGIIELSNVCTSGCHYCGISIHNQQLKRYRMTQEEIISAVDQAVNQYGFKALVLQSGEGAYRIDELVDIIKAIKEKFAVLIFISFGNIGEQGLAQLFNAGARGLLMRFETSNADLYARLHPGYFLEERLAQINYAHKLGYLIVTGSLIGLPGQTDNDIINDITLAAQLNAEMFSCGPFISHPQTPLNGTPSSNEERILKVIAVARFAVASQTKILVTTGFETLSALARQKGLACGGNSVMLNVTPLAYRELYSIYPQRAHITDSVQVQIDETINLLKGLGRAPTDLGVGQIN